MKMNWDLWNVLGWDPSKRKEGELLIQSLEATGMSEKYDQGEFKKRLCDSLTMIWLKNDQALDATRIQPFVEFIRTKLLSDLDLWSGNLYPDDETEFLIISEFDRLYNYDSN